MNPKKTNQIDSNHYYKSNTHKNQNDIVVKDGKMLIQPEKPYDITNHIFSTQMNKMQIAESNFSEGNANEDHGNPKTQVNNNIISTHLQNQDNSNSNANQKPMTQPKNNTKKKRGRRITNNETS